jgi:hypothetical protein
MSLKWLRGKDTCVVWTANLASYLENQSALHVHSVVYALPTVAQHIWAKVDHSLAALGVRCTVTENETQKRNSILGLSHQHSYIRLPNDRTCRGLLLCDFIKAVIHQTLDSVKASPCSRDSDSVQIYSSLANKRLYRNLDVRGKTP